MSFKRILMSAIGFAISALVVFLFGHKFPVQGILWPNTIYGYAQISLAGILFWIAIMLRALGWRLLLDFANERPASSLSLANIVSVSTVINLLVPARMGDIYRVVMANRKFSTYSSSIVSLLVEKVSDVVVLVFVGTLVCGLNIFSELTSHAGYLIMSILGLVAVIAAVAIFFRNRRVRQLRFYESILIIPFQKYSIYNLFMFLGYTLVFWLFNLIALCFLFYSIHVRVSILTTVTALVATNLGLAIPSAPGGIGIYEYTMGYVLLAHGISKSVDGNVAITIHALQYILYGLIGLVSYFVLVLDGASPKRRNAQVNAAIYNQTE